MKKSGKILFFNPNDGNGIIITSDKNKVPFHVGEWDDFDTMPSLGLEVVFEYEDTKALSISSKPPHYEETQDILNQVDSIDDILNQVSIEQIPEESPALQDDPYTQENTLADEDKALSQQNDEQTQIDKDETLESDEEIEEEEPFEKEPDIDHLTEDQEEEKWERKENVTLDLNIHHAVSNYFSVIEKHIKDRIDYKKVSGRLDYIVIRRFLWTMFNNLSEIDIHLITPQIRNLSIDLKLTAKIYDDLFRKTKYPALAYEEVFLSCQNEYMKIKQGAQDMIDKLSRLRTEEKHVGSILKVKKEEVAKDIHTEEFDLLTNELKSLNGAYVDIVHMMAELDERYKSDLKQLQEFEKEYRDDFYELFAKATEKYKEDLADILSAQAYLLDSKLWQEVKKSKAVKSYFKKSSISGELNTRTYLKYFLDSLDQTKALDENKKLFEVYDYLLSIHTDYVVIVSATAGDALDYDAELKQLPKGYKTKAFVDEKRALKWAIHHTVKIIIVEDQLQTMDSTTFLNYYQKYVLITPKIILLGNKPKANTLTITKLLSKGVTPRVILKNVQELLQEK